MNRIAKLPFDPNAFLSKVNGGRAISDYRKDQIVYRQGESADSVFYIRSGKVKKTVISEQGKEAVVALLGTGDFFGEGCLTGQPLRLATGDGFDERAPPCSRCSSFLSVFWLAGAPGFEPRHS